MQARFLYSDVLMKSKSEMSIDLDDLPQGMVCVNAVLDFSDGSSAKGTLCKTKDERVSEFRNRKVSWVCFAGMDVEDANVWCSMSALVVWGRFK